MNTQKHRRQPEFHLQILLIKRGNDPFQGMWALPGGFVGEGETALSAAIRELKEETGVEFDSSYIKQLYTYTEPDRDPRSRVFGVAYLALSDTASASVQAGDDASEAEWFEAAYSREEDIASLTLESGEITIQAQLAYGDGEEPHIRLNTGLAFDHAKIIAMALEYLRLEVDCSDISLNFLPETFTLPELQSIYEVIKGEKIHQAAFRRKFADYIAPTGVYTETNSRYPALLYKSAKQ
ncbi:MAG: NUDIX hydrolase [Eubacteriaceae bacterium]|nr:NUDIX hydrolase [Eubacteriaceae bacterium]